MISMKIMGFVAQTVNKSTKKKRKKVLAWFFKRVKNLYSQSDLIQCLLYLRSYYKQFTREQRRCLALFLGGNWKARENGKLLADFLTRVNCYLSKTSLSRQYEEKIDKANKFLSQRYFTLPSIKHTPILLKDLIGSDDYLQLGEKNIQKILRVTEQAIRIDAPNTYYLLTVTAPAYLHSNNNAQSAKMASNYIQQCWTRFRALIWKHGYGDSFRAIKAVELHKDMTPHTHILINTDCPQEELDRLCNLAFLPEDTKDEIGASEYRYQLDCVSGELQLEEAIRKTLNYVVKYLAKTMFFTGMSEEVKATRGLMSVCRFRAISLSGFGKLTRILRLAFKFRLTGINWPSARNYQVELEEYDTYYTYYIVDDMGNIITAWSCMKWFATSPPIV